MTINFNVFYLKKECNMAIKRNRKRRGGLKKPLELLQPDLNAKVILPQPEPVYEKTEKPYEKRPIELNYAPKGNTPEENISDSKYGSAVFDGSETELGISPDDSYVSSPEDSVSGRLLEEYLEAPSHHSIDEILDDMGMHLIKPDEKEDLEDYNI